MSKHCAFLSCLLLTLLALASIGHCLDQTHDIQALLKQLRISIDDEISLAEEEPGFRRKRDLATTAQEPDLRGLEVILDPISAIVGVNLTELLNNGLKSAISGLLGTLQCSLGQTIFSPLVGILNTVVDFIFPCDTCADMS